MPDKVVTLVAKSDKPPGPTIDPALVEICHSLLEAAKRGDLRGIAFATVTIDQTYSGGFAAGQGWVEADEIAPVHNAMTTALHALVRRWGRYCDGLPD